MKNLLSYFFTFLFLPLFITNFTSAQQWTDAQKEVWAGVEKYNEIGASGNAQEFMSYVDDSYVGWMDALRAPMNKANTSKWVEYGFKNDSVLVYTLTPLAIWVKGDFAYVDYYSYTLYKNKETGKNEQEMDSWTDILMKKNGKWIMIGDHGGRIPTPQQNNQ